MHFGEKYFFGWGTTSRLLRVLKKSGPFLVFLVCMGVFLYIWVISRKFFLFGWGTTFRVLKVLKKSGPFLGVLSMYVDMGLEPPPNPQNIYKH